MMCLMSFTRRGLALGVYTTCRGIALAAILLWPSHVPVPSRIDAFDAGYYEHIATSGYPHTLTPGVSNPIAFFPGYPLLVRALATLTHLPTWGAQLTISLVAGAAATVLIVRVVEVTTDEVIGLRSGLCWQALPQAFLLCVGYSEALFIAVCRRGAFACTPGEVALGGRGRGDI